MRIGHGYDIHRFGSDKPLMLGGVLIEGAPGVIAHSDGDVLLHALADALLGSLALGDIGQHFPDTSAEFANADSRQLLRHCYGLLQARGYRLINADISVQAQTPKLAPYIAAIRACIAQDLEVALDDISVKATTTEGLGPIGRKEGLAVHAVVLVSRSA